MTRDELRSAVEGPAQKMGMKFEDGLVNRILDHIEMQSGNLPLLEFALTELWGKERLQSGLLRNQQYDDIGGVARAISKRADEQFEKISSDQQDAAVHMFTRLIRVAAANEEGTDTRQIVRLSELNATEQAVAQSFIAARLLVVSRNESANLEIIEVAHEALIHNWDRLKEWVNKDREFLLWRQRLNVKISDWERTNRDEGSLLYGAFPAPDPSSVEANSKGSIRDSDFTAYYATGLIEISKI